MSIVWFPHPNSSAMWTKTNQQMPMSGLGWMTSVPARPVRLVWPYLSLSCFSVYLSLIFLFFLFFFPFSFPVYSFRRSTFIWKSSGSKKNLWRKPRCITWMSSEATQNLSCCACTSGSPIAFLKPFVWYVNVVFVYLFSFVNCPFFSCAGLFLAIWFVVRYGYWVSLISQPTAPTNNDEPPSDPSDDDADDNRPAAWRPWTWTCIHVFD